MNLFFLLLPQDPIQPGQEWSGVDGWLILAVREGCYPQENWEDLDPADTLLVVFGEPPARDPGWTAFVRRGGRLLIASDRPAIDRVLAGFGVSLRPGPLRVKSGVYAYSGYRDCPVVAPNPTEEIFRDVLQIAFNKPAAFEKTGDLDILARLPPLSDRSEPPCILASSSRRVFLLSDYSQFINLMIPEANNALFAQNLLRVLKRPKMLFVCNGRIIGPGEIGGLPPFPPGTIRALNPVLRKLETEGALNQLARRAWPAVLAGATLLSVAFFLLWTVRRETRPPDTPAVCRITGDDADPRRRNYRLAASALLDRFFESDPPPPPWREWSARRNYNLLRRARRRLPASVSARRFSRLLQAARALGVSKWT
jgi:hypothetical protein